MSFSFPYRTVPHAPYWGPTNAQSNFCEEDYIITTYIAEFINTWTSATYAFYAYHGIKSNWNRPDAILRSLPYLGIAGVGILSAVFHATMKNYTQWCDDLSMLIATTTVLHRVVTFDKPLSVTVSFGLASTAFVALFFTWHCMVDDTLVHPILFGIMVFAVANRTRSVISARVPEPRLRMQVRKLARWGTFNFGTGFVLWCIDNSICDFLTATKRSIGLPWGFILELHGWWHIFTGIGVYIFIALVEYLTSKEVGQPLGTGLAWPANWLAGGAGEEKLNENGVAKSNEKGKGKKAL